MTEHEFRLPDVGEGVAEGEIVEWLVSEGDAVSEDQPVAEVETDKAVVEVPSPYDGTVKELHYSPGDVVEVGSVIVTFETAETDQVEEKGGNETQPSTEESGGSSPEGKTFASPSVRQLARRLDVDIDAVTGTGPSGRVSEEDVRRAAESESDTKDVGTPKEVGTEISEPSESISESRERTLATPATRRVANELDVDINAIPATEQREGEAFVTAAAVQEYAQEQRAAKAEQSGSAQEKPGEERVPYRGIRRTIGEQMERSKYTAPHVTHHDTVVVNDLVEWRSELKERANERGIRLTFMPLVMTAVVEALKDFPRLNSELDEANEEIIHKRYYNIGVAVGTDDGLMVPVVENVDEKSLLEVADEMNGLIDRARDRSISREEMQGGTFTITNFGAIGGEYATPIINYPEVAILGLGSIEERPVVEDGEVVAKHTLPLSLSIDHRVVDGALAAEFVNQVKEYLRNPKLLLL
ncbi:MAG: dihydrolipoamide acetyltransferase family protein [Halobacteriaceae archaeon]